MSTNRWFLSLINYQTAFVSALLLTALGAILNLYGLIVNIFFTPREEPATPAIGLQFSGAFIATLFWVIILYILHQL